MHIWDLHIVVCTSIQNIYFSYFICAYCAYFLHIWYCIFLHILKCLFLHLGAYFAYICIFCIYMHILSLLAYVSFTYLSGTVWLKLVMLDFVEDSEPDSRFPGIGGRSLMGGLALTAGDRSSTGVLVDRRYLRLACRVVDLVQSVLLFLKLGQSVLRAHDGLRGWR